MMKDVLSAIEKRHQEHQDSILLEAQTRANEHKESILEEYDAHLPEKRKEIERQARFRKKQGLSLLERQNKFALDQVKNDTVARLLDECKEYFTSMSSDDFIRIVQGALDRNDQTFKPRIFVEQKHFEAVQKHFGVNYQVLEAHSLTSGFVLAYKTYDISFDVDQLFSYRRDILSKWAMAHLYEDTQNV